jgi:hypothetical protein
MKSEDTGYDENFVKEALTSIGGESQKMALQQGLKPHIKNNEVNSQLVLFLKRKGLISSFKEKKEEIQVTQRENDRDYIFIHCSLRAKRQRWGLKGS